MSTAFLHTIHAQFGANFWDLTNLATEVHISNISPGGHAEAEVTYEDIDPITTPYIGSNLAISDSLGRYWTGRVEDVDVDFRPGGGKVRVVARGYSSSAADQIITSAVNWDAITGDPSTTFKQGTGTWQAFKNVIISSCPEIQISDSFNHVGAVLAGDTAQLLGKTAQDIFNELAALGSDIGGGQTTTSNVFWHVYCQEALQPGIGTTNELFYPFMELQFGAQAPSYSIAMSDCDITSISWQLKWIYNRVTVQWKDNDGNTGSATAVSPTSKSNPPAGIGIWRDHYVDASSHIGTQYEANLIAQLLVNKLSQIRPIGRQITIKYPMNVQDAGGGPVPLWRVLAGRVIRINGINPNNAQLTGNTDFYIRQTEWDEWNRELVLVTEEMESIPQIVGRAIFGEAQLPTSPIASKVAIPKNDVVMSPGTASGPAGISSGTGAFAPTGIVPGQKSQTDSGAAERDISNLHFCVNGFETAIPTAKELGWIEIPFAGLITRLAVYATKKSGTNKLAPALATINFYDSSRTDFTHRTLIKTMNVTTAGFLEDITTTHQIYRDHVIMAEYTAGDAEILVVALQHHRDASIADPINGTQTPTISNVTTAGGPNNSVIISWKTDLLSTGQVTWGTNSGPTWENNGPVDNVLKKDHSIPIPALAPGKTMSFLITAHSKDGVNSTYGGTFTT